MAHFGSRGLIAPPPPCLGTVIAKRDPRPAQPALPTERTRNNPLHASKPTDKIPNRNTRGPLIPRKRTIVGHPFEIPRTAVVPTATTNEKPDRCFAFAHIRSRRTAMLVGASGTFRLSRAFCSCSPMSRDSDREERPETRPASAPRRADAKLSDTGMKEQRGE